MGEKDGSECDRGDESRGCGIGERGFRIECGVATAGMGPQPGDLRDEHALRQQRDVFESISSHENSIGLLTTESSATVAAAHVVRGAASSGECRSRFSSAMVLPCFQFDVSYKDARICMSGNGL